MFDYPHFPKFPHTQQGWHNSYKKVLVLKNIIRNMEWNWKNSPLLPNPTKKKKKGIKLVQGISLISGTVLKNPGRMVTLSLLLCCVGAEPLQMKLSRCMLEWCFSSSSSCSWRVRHVSCSWDDASKYSKLSFFTNVIFAYLFLLYVTSLTGCHKKLVEFPRVLTVVHCIQDQFISSHVPHNQNECHICQTKKPWFSAFILSPLTVC